MVFVLHGFDPSAVSLQSAAHNMPSASFLPSVIDQYLRTEREKGRVAGTGKWRLILDLSSPLGHSVNDDILRNPFLFST